MTKSLNTFASANTRALFFVVGCVALTIPMTTVVYGDDKDSVKKTATSLFPSELTDFLAHPFNPVFSATGMDTWDELIRERGFVLKEKQGYRLWYTGYRKGDKTTRMLGLATSSDGVHWKRHLENPIYSAKWTEDIFVMKHDDQYYLFAEGLDDRAHQMSSADGIHWKDEGTIDVRKSDGTPIEPGPYGTPTVWTQDGVWYLFYERRDAAVWLAKSTDRRVWTNVQDEPVLSKGPGAYDQHAVAMNQVFRYQGRYYATYHASAHRPWRDWSTNLAVSDDLVHWKKYPKNPIVGENQSSGIYLHDGHRWLLYTMHPQVNLFYSRPKVSRSNLMRR